MIRCVFGVPGSGKSYLAMKFLTDRFEYDSFYHTFIPKTDGLLVITNISGLKIHHLNLNDLVSKYGIEKFFTIENFEIIQKQYKTKNIILVIDEAQQFFDTKYYDKDVFYFFEYHRHLGLDIFLITQSQVNLPRRLIALSEQIYTALPRSISPAVFSYSISDVKGTKLGTKRLKKDKIVFLMYKSFENDEIDKPKSAYKKYVFAFVVVLCVFFGAGFTTLRKAKSYTTPKDNKSLTTKTTNISRKTGPASTGPVLNDSFYTDFISISSFINIDDKSKYFKVFTDVGLSFNYDDFKKYKCLIFKQLNSIKCEQLPAWIYEQARVIANREKELEEKNNQLDGFAVNTQGGVSPP